MSAGLKCDIGQSGPWGRPHFLPVLPGCCLALGLLRTLLGAMDHLGFEASFCRTGDSGVSALPLREKFPVVGGWTNVSLMAQRRD